MGTLSNNNSEDNLLIPSLIHRVKKESIDEVIIATSATVEGQTTAHYIQNILKDIDFANSLSSSRDDSGVRKLFSSTL